MLKFQWLTAWKGYFLLTGHVHWVTLGSSVGILGWWNSLCLSHGRSCARGRRDVGILRTSAQRGGSHFHARFVDQSQPPQLAETPHEMRWCCQAFVSEEGWAASHKGGSWIRSTADGETRLRWMFTPIMAGGPCKAVTVLWLLERFKQSSPASLKGYAFVRKVKR